MPLVSVVIPTYNCAQFLAETLRSILCQNFRDFEIIVVDDGSTDNSEEIVTAIKSDRIRYVKLPNSGGPSRPRNVGIQVAHGKYISLCDSDDVMLPEKLAETVAFLEHQSNLGFVFTNMALCHEDGTRLPGTFLDMHQGFWKLEKDKVGERWFRIKSQDAYDGLFYENYVGISGVVAPKQVLLAVGGFDESLSPAADWDMFFRISNKYDIGYVDMIGHLYRQRGSNLTSKGMKLTGPDLLRALRKQLEEELSERIHIQARRRIGQVLFDIGHHYQSCGDMKNARHHYQLSLRERFSWRALKGLLISFLGGRVVALLKVFKVKAKLQAIRVRGKVQADGSVL